MSLIMPSSDYASLCEYDVKLTHISLCRPSNCSSGTRAVRTHGTASLRSCAAPRHTAARWTPAQTSTSSASVRAGPPSHRCTSPATPTRTTPTTAATIVTTARGSTAWRAMAPTNPTAAVLDQTPRTTRPGPAPSTPGCATRPSPTST